MKAAGLIDLLNRRIAANPDLAEYDVMVPDAEGVAIEADQVEFDPSTHTVLIGEVS